MITTVCEKFSHCIVNNTQKLKGGGGLEKMTQDDGRRGIGLKMTSLFYMISGENSKTIWDLCNVHIKLLSANYPLFTVH